MTLIRPIKVPQASPVLVSETPEGLSAIHDHGTAAAVWDRQPRDSFQSWINGLSPDLLPRARLILAPGVVRQTMTALCDAKGLPVCPNRSMLIDDISALADIFAGVMQAPYLRLRLDVITTNACRKFHIDALTARLVCTYRGTGTQYGITQNGSDPQDITTVGTGSPIVLRGTDWPETPPSGLRHRSPPIEGSGESRLVLVLDPITELPNDLQHDGFLH